MFKVVCFVYLVAVLVGCLGVSVLKFDLDEVVNKKLLTLGFGLKVVIGGSLFVSGLQLSKTPFSILR